MNYLILVLALVLTVHGQDGDVGDVTTSSPSISEVAQEVPTTVPSLITLLKTVDPSPATELLPSSVSPAPSIVSTADPLAEWKISNYTPECQEKLVKADKCLAEAIFVGQEEDAKIPTTDEEIDTYCVKAKETYECVSNYRKCLKLFPKTFFGIVTRDVKKTMKKTCSATGRAEIIKHLKCFEVTSLDTVLKIMNGFTKVLNHIADETDPNEMIPQLCCSYHYMVDGGIKHVHELCEAATGPSTAKYVMNLIESVLSSAVDLGCGKHHSLSVCNKLLPKEMDLFVNLTIAGREEPIKYTPIVPMLKIAQNLDSSLNI